ncbi:protein toll-like [Bicyclus anynana]|uniref:Protein toll-like n=1 Tax=Bicyclus anynana TaxID=110368 RepID=A0ABM3LL32_BICAN|nr:protein toll-like [Bicyclus anynana]
MPLLLWGALLWGALLRGALLGGALLGGDAPEGPGPRCAARHNLSCTAKSSSADDYFYLIRGKQVKITYIESQYFKLACEAGVALGDPALPALPRAAPLARVVLLGCAPPPAGYAAALAALNVSVGAGGALELREQPAAPALRAAHLAGLRLAELELARGGGLTRPPDEPLRPHADALTALPASLRVLRLRHAALQPDALRALPPALGWLLLENVTGPAPAAALVRLPALERLTLADAALRRLDLRGSALRDVSLTAPLRELLLGARVERLTLRGALDATLRGDCAALREVQLQNVTRALPARWLARCAGVRRVAVLRSPGALGGEELAGARALRELDACWCGLRELPAQWLADAAQLRALNLSHNALRRLPALPGALQELRATHNRLEPAALQPLGALPALRALVLDHNAPLRDMCGRSGDLDTNTLSPLDRAHGLRLLSLQRCGLRDVCRDWRALRQLAELRLSGNNISSLGADDLRWERAQRSSVDLRLNPVRVDFSHADYLAALSVAPPAAAAAAATELLLDTAQRCDCHDYWFARVLRERPWAVGATLEPLCAGPASAAAGGHRALRDLRLHELACDVSQDCPAGCRCLEWPTGADLLCERAGLAAVPRAPRPGLRELRLAGNDVAELRAADVPASLERLDLSDNRLARVEPAAAALLWDARPRSVLLAGNPLDCSCAALPLLRALAGRPTRVEDLARARCADGRPLAEAAARAAGACGAPPAWALALGALVPAAAAALAAACLVRPATRHRLKRFLFERGLCLRWALGARAADADARPYDAFVSFSHHDQRYADELTRRLERAGRRLCLHERDWLPGEWIPAQIARSVREARRTLVLLSEHFLRSTWARAELREAYGAALGERHPRLLLVLLPGFEAARAAAADPALRAYVERVTYLSWDDAHFWRKLTLALPAGARPAPLAPPAAPPPPP